LNKKYKYTSFNVYFNDGYGTRLRFIGGRRGRDRIVVGFTTTYAIGVYPT